ncbi:MAG: hypothetical protein SWH78_14410, partial [Thermodesulfobacteriota bacterium]|nr:hypothetical protein [Thermodesulfobacteriota bacterium]
FEIPGKISSLITAKAFFFDNRKLSAILTAPLGARIVVPLLMTVSRLHHFRGLYRLFAPFIVAREERSQAILGICLDSKMKPELSQVVNTEPRGQQPEKENFLYINEAGCAIFLHDNVLRVQIGMIDATGMQEGHVAAQLFCFFKRMTGYGLTSHPSSQQKELVGN